MMNKFIKALIIINGLIIPLFICFLAYKLISDFTDRGVYYETESILVGEALDQARKDSLALQGISYETPLKIYNATNFYLPIAVKTYKEAKELSKFAYTANDIDQSFSNYFNVLFLDNNYNVIGQLVDKKASITEIFINRGEYNHPEEPVDKTVKHIAYQIGFDDSNNDGKLNSLDFHDLYISGLDGKNLTQVTSQKDIVDFNFINSNTELIIRFKDRNNMRDEYKHIKFARYTIATGLFTELKEIEDKLIEIESKLIR